MYDFHTQNGLRASRLLAGLMLVFVASGCGATRLERAWVSPEVDALNVRRIVTIALSNDPGRRRAMEASMAEEIRDQIPGVAVTESSTLISDTDIRDEARVRDRLESAGFDARMVMRITDIDRQDVYVPGRTTGVPAYYRTFWGYYRYWVPISYEPGYVEHNRDVQVETAMYSTAGDGELVYSAVSQTLNPAYVADLAEHVTSVVAKDLKEKGVLR
jgi:hypothetical protein